MVKILDQYGQPIDKGVLTEQQTELSRIGFMNSTFAQHPSRGLTPPKLAQILQNAEQGDIQAQCALFEDMEEKDGHIFAELSKRKRTMLNVDWDIVPPRNASDAEKRAAEYVKEIINDMTDFNDLLFDMGDAISKGFSCLEYKWERLGKEWIPHSLEHRDPGWFTVDPEKPNELRLVNGDYNGEELRPFGWIAHVHKAKSGYVTRSGLGRVLSWPFLFKNYSVRDLAEFLEIYGLPLRLGKYSTGASDDEKSTLLRAVVGIGHNAAGIVPKGMDIDFMEAAKGSSDPFQVMIAWCERTQSKAILGATLTSQSDGWAGSYALGKVHDEVRLDIRDSDLSQIAKTLTRDLIYPLVSLNVSGIESIRRCPRFVFDTKEPEDLKLYSDSIPNLVNMGMEIPIDFVHEKLNIPKAQSGEKILAKATTVSASLSSAALSNQNDLASKNTERLSADAAKAMDALIEPVRILVEESKSLESLRDGLLSLYGQLDEKQLAEQMSLALSAANLGGRYEVQQGK